VGRLLRWRARSASSFPRPPPPQRAATLHPLDLLVEELVLHGDGAELALEMGDLVVTFVSGLRAQPRQAAFEEPFPPLRKGRPVYPQLARELIEALPPKKPKDCFSLALG